MRNSGDSLRSTDAEPITGDARDWQVLSQLPTSLASRLLVSSLQAQVEEIARLAEATGSMLTRLIDHTGSVAPLTDEVRRTIPRWHFAMLNDQERNDALAVALASTAHVAPQDPQDGALNIGELGQWYFANFTGSLYDSPHNDPRRLWPVGLRRE